MVVDTNRLLIGLDWIAGYPGRFRRSTIYLHDLLIFCPPFLVGAYQLANGREHHAEHHQATTANAQNDVDHAEVVTDLHDSTTGGISQACVNIFQRLSAYDPSDDTEDWQPPIQARMPMARTKPP